MSYSRRRLRLWHHRYFLSLRPASYRDSHHLSPNTGKSKQFLQCRSLYLCSGLCSFEAAKPAPKKAACSYCSQVGHLHSTVCSARDRTALVQSVRPPRAPFQWPISPASAAHCCWAPPFPPEESARTLPEALLESGLDSLKAAGASGGACPRQGGHVMQASSISFCKVTHLPAVVLPEMRSKIPRAISTIADRRRRVLGGIMSVVCCYVLPAAAAADGPTSPVKSSQILPTSSPAQYAWLT
ncbi:hypothetical protein CCMA1212_004621 [Trichoderma ghanense]|uniref:Uncharacterized protein n=1 Tax=Trichoderma ghanense TaxID=65468 RepID=A0ABY2H7L0_9HYPO